MKLPTALRPFAAAVVFTCIFAAAVQAQPQAIESASTQPATQPAETLLGSVHRAVETAQKQLRVPTPATRPTVNSAQEKSPQNQYHNFDDLEAQIVGKTGPIAITVVDVFEKRHLLFELPPGLGVLRDTVPFLVKAVVDNPTARYLTPDQRRRLQQHPPSRAPAEAAKLRDDADRLKPNHQLWILAEDPAVAQWARGSRRVISGTVIAAYLRPGLNDYVKAVLVVTLEHPAPTTAPTASVSR